jgi:hypothetical protein
VVGIRALVRGLAVRALSYQQDSNFPNVGLTDLGFYMCISNILSIVVNPLKIVLSLYEIYLFC